MKTSFFLFLFSFTCFLASGQTYQSQYGYQLPVYDTIRALVIFAETDCDGGPTLNANWPAGSLPADADEWLDPVWPASPALLNGKMTKYYYESSFGKFVILGDYYPEVMTVPCSANPNKSRFIGISQAVALLDDEPDPIITANGLTLDDFDLIINEGLTGKYKARGSNSVIDLVLVIYRNHWAGYNLGWNSSTGEQINGHSIASATMVNAVNGSPDNYFDFVVAVHEFGHSLFGGNNFHLSAGDASQHTFPFIQNTYGLMGSSQSSSNRVNGWERWFLGWYGWRNDALTEKKDTLIACLNTSRNEVSSDLTMPEDPITHYKDTLIRIIPCSLPNLLTQPL